MKRLAILLLPLTVNGCALGLAAGAYRDSLAPGQHAAFRADFERRNAELEKTGQPPVAWCTALRRQSLNWYLYDPSCRAS